MGSLSRSTSPGRSPRFWLGGPGRQHPPGGSSAGPTGGGLSCCRCRRPFDVPLEHDQHPRLEEPDHRRKDPVNDQAPEPSRVHDLIPADHQPGACARQLVQQEGPHTFGVGPGPRSLRIQGPTARCHGCARRSARIGPCLPPLRRARLRQTASHREHAFCSRCITGNMAFSVATDMPVYRAFVVLSPATAAYRAACASTFGPDQRAPRGPVREADRPHARLGGPSSFRDHVVRAFRPAPEGITLPPEETS